MNYSEKLGLFKEQNAGFSAQIQSVTMTKTWFFKKGMLFRIMFSVIEDIQKDKSLKTLRFPPLPLDYVYLFDRDYMYIYCNHVMLILIILFSIYTKPI